MASDSEIREKLAQRYLHKRELGVPVGERGGSVEQDIDAGLAEKFVCDKLGCPFNDSVVDGNDGGYDMIYRGYKIDVKWLGRNKYDNKPRMSGRVMVDLDKINRADIYVGVRGSADTKYEIVGWCTVKDLMSRDFFVSPYSDDHTGDHRRYAVHVRDLRNFYTLRNIKEKVNGA